MQCIIMGAPQGCTKEDVEAAEEEVAPIADYIMEDLDLGDEE